MPPGESVSRRSRKKKRRNMFDIKKDASMISLHGHRFWWGRGGGGVGAVLIPHVRAAVRPNGSKWG